MGAFERATQLAFMLLLFLPISLCTVAATDMPDTWLAPGGVSWSRGVLRLQCEQTSGLLTLPVESAGSERSFLPVPGDCTGMALFEDRAVLTLHGDGVKVLDLQGGEVQARIAGPNGICAPLVDGRRLYVCDRFGNSVLCYNISSGECIGKVPCMREPIAQAASNRQLIVANLLPKLPATQVTNACAITVIDMDRLSVTTNIFLPTGGVLPRGVATLGGHAFVVHQQARFAVPALQVSQGWMQSAALTVIDLSSLSCSGTVLLDEPRRGAGNPWDVKVAGGGQQLVITHAGTHELSVIDLPALLDRLQSAGGTGGVIEDLSFLSGIRQRIELAGKGPRSLCVVGTTAYVAEFFSDSVAVVDLESRRQVDEIKLRDRHSKTRVEAGEEIFHDASVSYEGWQSCASCHPDGRADALNWDLLNDGIGNPKNTKSLLLCVETPPAMSLGIRANAEVAIGAGFRHILFTLPGQEDIDAVQAYLDSLQPRPSPFLVGGELSASATEGKRLFHSENVGCAECHSGKLLTDLRKWDVGTANKDDDDKRLFDTPTLVECWRTAPYLHDGSTLTVLEVLTEANSKDQHGHTSHLTSEELHALADYVLSL